MVFFTTIIDFISLASSVHIEKFVTSAANIVYVQLYFSFLPTFTSDFLNFNCLCVFTSPRFFLFLFFFFQEKKPLCLNFSFKCCISHMRPVISLLECDKTFALNRNNGLYHPLMWFTVYLQVRRRVEQRGYVRITRMANFKQMHLSWLPCYD